MKKGEVTRHRIVALAAPLFNQRGYAGCSMGDIMEATGLEKGGIYRYFDSKETLAAEALQFSIAQSRKIHTGDLRSIPTALGKLRYALDRFAREPSAIRGGCPLMNTAVDSDDGNEVLRNLVKQAFADWRSRLAAIVRQGIRNGEIQRSCRPAQLADTLIASLEGALVMSRIQGNDAPLKHARAMMDVLLNAVSCPA